MGFKISSLSTMNNISSELSSLSGDVTSRNSSCSSTLSELSGLISGDGVETKLNKLSSAISTNGKQACDLLQKVSTFISEQASSYTVNEESVNTVITDINATLEGMEV